MIDYYYRFEKLPPDIKARHGINSKTRIDCTGFTGDYPGFKFMKNKKGQMFFYLVEAREFVKSESRRRADWALAWGSVNLTSLYFEDLDFPQYAYGYPNGNRKLRNGEPNPLFPFYQDAFLFSVSEDFSILEALVIVGARNLITAHYQQVIDGQYTEEIQSLRGKAKPFWPY